jgi:hypothetical protein
VVEKCTAAAAGRVSSKTSWQQICIRTGCAAGIIPDGQSAADKQQSQYCRLRFVASHTKQKHPHYTQDPDQAADLQLELVQLAWRWMVVLFNTKPPLNARPYVQAVPL